MKFVNREMGVLSRSGRAGGDFDRLIGTSGTILSLGTMAVARASGTRRRIIRNRARAGESAHRASASGSSEADIAERLRVPGMDPRRADLVGRRRRSSSTRSLRRLGADEFTLCDLALREGLVLDYIHRNTRARSGRSSAIPDVRRRSVVELGERCGYCAEHAQQVARLALTHLRPDAQRPRARPTREREWLEYGALLHDVGVHISYERHHRHSYYLIKNGELRGFDPQEIEIIAPHRALSPAGDAEEDRTTGYGDPEGTAAARPSRRWPRCCGWPRGSTAATRRSIAALDVVPRGDDYLDPAARDGRRGARALGRAPARGGRSRTCSSGRFDSKSSGRRAARQEDAHAHAEQPDHAARVPGKAVRRGRHRRVRKDDAARAAGKVAQAQPAIRSSMTEWNSSALVKAATKTGKKKNALTPMTFSLLHATDFADRLLYNIIPPLKAGMIVLADRYAYTGVRARRRRAASIARWVRELYSFAVQPDLAVYFRVPIDVSVDRLLARRVKLKFYEAGMDMGWSTQRRRELPASSRARCSTNTIASSTSSA